MSGGKPWTGRQLFAHPTQKSNVALYCGRFEYQMRKALHGHATFWFRDINYINLERIKAEMPTSAQEYGLVKRVQIVSNFKSMYIT